MTSKFGDMINSSTYPLDAELIASAIADWARIESPSYDPVAVNQMMDVASSTMESLGATVERTPGSDGYGDVVTARFNWGPHRVSWCWATWILFIWSVHSKNHYRSVGTETASMDRV